LSFRSKAEESAFLSFDEAAKTVSYNITITPGDPYTLHDLSLPGLSDPATQAKFQAAFPINAPYNPVAVEALMLHDPNVKFRPTPTTPLAYKATAYPATHTVDLVFSFAGPTTINVR
jgi:hypothetical protein